MAIFAKQLAGELDRVRREEPPAYRRKFEPLQPIPKTSFRSRLKASVPMILRQGSEREPSVRVMNTSPVRWEPADTSGIILAARWRNLDLHPHVFMDGRVPLPQSVERGQTIELELPIRVPRRGLPILLDIDLGEDGVCWFQERGRSGHKFLVFPLPAKRETASAGRA